ncbi:MAG: hypothetical protein COB36_06495 [Alphaproteobacteria bacterium]|nr:MAG: hypothetical protein COB36_06495 [Alphaproteobacteria bacterium]
MKNNRVISVGGRAIVCVMLLLISVSTGFAQSKKLYSGYMGFTPWPYDLTIEAVEDTYDFIHQNATIISHHFDNGISWDAALNNTPFPAHLKTDWQGRLDKTRNMKVFLSLTPINFSRDGLALNWAEQSDNQPLPEVWRDMAFDDPETVKAYTNYVLRSVAFFKPDFLAIGVEVNVLISNAPQKWDAYLALNQSVYKAVKARHPDLPVFSTVQYEHFRGIEAVSKNNLELQKPAVTALMKHSDMLVLSTYKYGFIHPNKITDTYFDEMLSYKKPMAIAETGAMSKTTFVAGIPLFASENNQKAFVSMILSQAAKHNFVFVVHWLPIDFDAMLSKLPKEYSEIAKAWVHSGLVDKKMNKKPAYDVWQKHLAGRHNKKAPR